MSIKIVTTEESKYLKELCNKFGEVCEIKIGKAKIPYWCDNTGTMIEKGNECAVVLILPTINHHNYTHQKSMMDNYVE